MQTTAAHNELLWHYTLHTWTQSENVVICETLASWQKETRPCDSYTTQCNTMHFWEFYGIRLATVVPQPHNNWQGTEQWSVKNAQTSLHLLTWLRLGRCGQRDLIKSKNLLTLRCASVRETTQAAAKSPNGSWLLTQILSWSRGTVYLFPRSYGVLDSTSDILFSPFRYPY